MCVIIHKPKGVSISDKKDMLEACWDNNRDGGGYAYVQGDHVKIEKGFMDKDPFIKAVLKKITDEREAIIHFRIATHGGVSPKQTHPFPISHIEEELHALNVKTGIVMAHNGWFRNCGEKHAATTRWEHGVKITEYKKVADSSLSDTQDFIKKYLSRSSVREQLMNPEFHDIFARAFDTDRVILMSPEGVVRFNLWREDEDYPGLFFSNSTYLPKKTYGNYSTYNKYGHCSVNVPKLDIDLRTDKPFVFLVDIKKARCISDKHPVCYSCIHSAWAKNIGRYVCMYDLHKLHLGYQDYDPKNMSKKAKRKYPTVIKYYRSKNSIDRRLNDEVKLDTTKCCKCECVISSTKSVKRNGEDYCVDCIPPFRSGNNFLYDEEGEWCESCNRMTYVPEYDYKNRAFCPRCISRDAKLLTASSTPESNVWDTSCCAICLKYKPSEEVSAINGIDICDGCSGIRR